jgi:outer membrane protein assembly factor BamB
MQVGPPRWQNLASVLSICVLLAPLFICSAQAGEQDWPAWRYDSHRSAATPNRIPSTLQRLWERGFQSRRPAWDDPLNLDLMTYDRVFEPIVMDGKLFVGFNDQDKLMAFDASSGETLWTAFTDGPVRLPPVGENGKVYFTSDDGHLYCVRADDGKQFWKVNGAPNSQHAIGNKRISSAWPARGGPVIRDGNVYFAASIWPFMGTFIYAVDAETGSIQWVNDSSGADYIKQPHSAPSFAGVAPQGALVATKDYLIIPGGRSVPAVFDRQTGTLKYFELNAGGKGTGGSFVAADEDHFYVHTREKGTRAFDIASGLKTAFMPNEPVLSGDKLFTCELIDQLPTVRCYDRERTIQWEVPADGRGDLILAGDHLVAAGHNTVTIIQLPTDESKAKVVETIELDSPAERVLVADNKLFVVTLDGRIIAFGDKHAKSANEPAPFQVAEAELGTLAPSEALNARLAEIQRDVSPEGYAFWFGDIDNPLLYPMAIQSTYQQFAIVGSDAVAIDKLRRQIDSVGRYGTVTAHAVEPGLYKAPQYVANTVFVSNQLAATADEYAIQELYQSVRPYGGVMVLLAESDPKSVADRVSAMNLEQAEVTVRSYGVLVRRVGALPGSADWTHQYGNIANTVKSDDSRVKLPLGVLWYGGSSNNDVLPRHGHGPPEQVVGGRLFIQGMDCLSARDVYTGRVLWKRQFEELGTFDVYFDATYEETPLDPKYNQVHIPGANGRGTNYVVTEDRVYILDGNVCLALDPATGDTMHRFELPQDKNGNTKEWGYIGVYKDVLIGGMGFAEYRNRYELEFESDNDLKSNKAGFGSKSLDRAASVALVGFDRYSGEQLWKVDSNHSFWHNGIVAGNDRIYCLDKNPQQIEDAMRRRGLANPSSYRIATLDYKTGELLWQVTDGIFGTWLGYSEKHDLLLHAGAKASDRLYAEVSQGMTVYKAASGEVQWKNESLDYAGPCILHNDLIITNANSYTESAGAFYIENGQQKMVPNPITGEPQPWKVTRAYGCNNIIASENMLTFRSGAAGFYDLLSEGGTGNLGGFKSGCTSNLVVANGVLNAPDYTRTCSCSYQNQTSLALVHMPDVELWSVNGASTVVENGDKITQLGINFGAPGDRRDESGVLWIDYPEAAGTNPPISIELNPEASYFRNHSSTMHGSPAPWVLSSGVDGVSRLRLQLSLRDDVGLEAGIPISHADDDAEEGESGEVDLSSSDLELVQDAGTQTVGLRFNGVNIDRGAEIRGAWLQFTCDEPASELTALIIAAQDTGNAERFSTDSHDISSRPRTRNEVSWNPGVWEKVGESTTNQRTPDLRTLVQALVDRDDWEAGNSMAFIVSGSGKRIANAYSGGDGSGARLVIDADQSTQEAREQVPLVRYDVRLYFAVPGLQGTEARVFDVFIGDKLVAQDVTVYPENKSEKSFVIHALENVPLGDELDLRFIAKRGQPVLSGIQITQSKTAE